MAVKQNNTEGNGAPTSGGADTKTNAVGNNSGTGGGTKSKKLPGNSAGGGLVGAGGVTAAADVGAQSAGCSGNVASGSGNIKANNNLNNNNAGGVGGAASKHIGAAVPPSKNDIAHILMIIERIEMKQQHIDFGNDIYKIYHHIIVQLSRVQIPRHSEEMKPFKEDILKVGDFLRKATEKDIYLFYLRIVCGLITNDQDSPTCAIAVIFQLFSNEMVYEAVQSLLAHKIPDKNIQKTVRLLSEWLRMCNFCQNLNLWIMAILKGLQEQQKYELYDAIALENIDMLFASVIVPVLRPKVAPIVFHMLYSVNQTPHVFHKILPKFALIVTYLKKQSNNAEVEQRDYAEETKKFLQQLVDLTSALMVRFYGYDELYEPVEQALKDFQPSYNYLNYATPNRNQQDESLDNASLLQHNNNAKVGLVNLGNTCYMNSVLQALAMTREFSREILLTESKSPLLIKMQQQIALMLYSMRYELTPSRVLNATRPPGFSPGLQQDSSEFLGYLLETLHEQELAFCKKTVALTTSSISDTDSEPIAKTFKQMEPPDVVVTAAAVEDGAAAHVAGNTIQTNDSSVHHNNNIESSSTLCSTAASTTEAVAADKVLPAAAQSTIEKTFTGKLATTYKCLTCGWQSRNIDSFRDLQLSFPEVKNDCASNYSVQDLIDYYCSSEKLYGDNQYFCEKCKRLSDAERFINVTRAPKNLILTLKHFKYDQKYHTRAKLMHKVFHDEKVSVKVCSADSLDEIASVHYDLYAGVVHSGFSMDSGHYYTYAADAANKWYKFNDSVVSPSKSEELHNLTPPNTPYILFYQMGARSNETPEAAAATTTTTSQSQLIKVEVPTPLTLEQLPRELRDYVQHDNCAFDEELKTRRLKLANAALQNAALQAKNNGSRGPRGDNYDDDDEDQPPPASGCGGNAMNINVNRFVF